MLSGRKGGGVSYIDVRKKRSWNAVLAFVLLIKNFWNSVLVCSIKKNAPVCNYSLQVYDINVSWSSSIDIYTRV
jgi:hypothetical protein